jgi:phosphoribosylformylglycinamidine cyclo-ligase
MPVKNLTYRKSGVDIDKANGFIESIKPYARMTRRPEVLAGIGGFGALCSLPNKKYKNPILVSTTDGVGTKLKVAQQVGRFDGLGIDLVAMNVNDVLTLGAEPLFFLDYFAVGKIEPVMMRAVVRSIAIGCKQAGCSLIGGETAEMPGLYSHGDFDIAGFCVGVVDREKVIDGKKAKAGQVIVGVASNGIHSNGFSFVRKAFKPEFILEHAEEILKPTRIYVKPILSLLQKEPVYSMAHITGGGFFDNIPRVLPKGCGAKIQQGSWPIPRVFGWLKDGSSATAKEMYRTFNMGIGFVLVTEKTRALKVIHHLNKMGEHAWIIGEIVKGSGVTIQ